MAEWLASIMPNVVDYSGKFWSSCIATGQMFLIAGGRRVTHHLVVVIRRGLGAHTADNSQLFHRRLLGDARSIASIIPAPVRYKPGGRDVHPICNTS